MENVTEKITNEVIIEATLDGPLIVKGLDKFTTSDGKAIETKPVLSLCRCGKSSSKPYCDGTHADVGFSSQKEPGRVPDKSYTFEGKDISIIDNAGVCSHAGYCDGNLPKVYWDHKDNKRIAKPDEGDLKENERVIKMCPSGALSYIKDNVLHKDFDREPEIGLVKDGPYAVVGNPILRDANGSKPESKEHYTLCRCGGSKNKPFCDGNHWYIKFEDNEEGAKLKDSQSKEVQVSKVSAPVLNIISEDVKSEDKNSEDKKSISEYRAIAREKLAGLCTANKVCDGDSSRLCSGQKFGESIGFGGAGQGKTFDANFKALAKYRFKMNIIKAHHEPEMEMEFLGRKIKIPVLVTSISGVFLSMNDAMSEPDFQRGMIEGAKLYGTIGLSGNTVDFPEHPGIDIIKENGGFGIPIFKPQSQDKLIDLFKKAEDADVIAIGVDLDGCGSTNWALRGKPVYRKSEEELKELVNSTKKPVIFKGIMCLEDAEKAVNAGAAAIDISNHGGRVLDYGQGVAEVLPEIAEKFKARVTIMADGAVRTGFDVLKLLALGADVALIGRPLARMTLAGGSVAVKQYLDYVESDFRRAMLMTGCDTLKEVNRNILVEGNL